MVNFYGLFYLILIIPIFILSFFSGEVAIVSVLFFLFCFYFLYKIDKSFFYSIFVLVVGWVWCAASLLYIENGAYITEQWRFGVFNNSSTRFFVYSVIFLLPSVIFLSLGVGNKNYKYNVQKYSVEKNFIFFSYFFCFFVVFSLLVVGFFYGFPLFVGMSRFEYWENIESLRKLVFLSPISCFFIGVCYSIRRSGWDLFIILLNIIILFLFSDKFTGPYLVVLYFISGSFVFNSIKKNGSVFPAWIYFIFLPIVFILMVSFVSYGYLALHGTSPEKLLEQILNRALGLQAHVWYGIDMLMNIDGSLLEKPSIFLSDNIEPYSPAGLPYLMYQVSPFDFVKSMRDAGIRFTNGYPAIVMASFGFWFGLVIQFLIGILFFIFFYYFLNKIARLQFFRLFLCLLFFNNVISNIFIMGEVYYIYRPLTIILFLFFIFDFIFTNNKRFILGVR